MLVAVVHILLTVSKGQWQPNWVIVSLWSKL